MVAHSCAVAFQYRHKFYSYLQKCFSLIYNIFDAGYFGLRIDRNPVIRHARTALCTASIGAFKSSKYAFFFPSLQYLTALIKYYHDNNILFH